MSMKIRITAKQFWAMQLGHTLMCAAGIVPQEPEQQLKQLGSVVDAVWSIREREQRRRNTESYFAWRRKYDAVA